MCVIFTYLCTYLISIYIYTCVHKLGCGARTSHRDAVPEGLLALGLDLLDRALPTIADFICKHLNFINLVAIKVTTRLLKYY